MFNQIRTVSETVGFDRLTPISDALNGMVDYDQIRILVAILGYAHRAAAVPRGGG